MRFHFPQSLYKESDPLPVCPSCAQTFHEKAACCPLCGFSFERSQEKFGSQSIKMRRIDDKAGCLKKSQRENLSKKFAQWEQKCPPVVMALHIPHVLEHQQLRQYALWALNSMEIIDPHLDRPEWTLLLVLDINNRAATFCYGYKLDYYLTEESLYPALVAGGQHLKDGLFEQGILLIMKKARNILAKQAAKLKSLPKFEQVLPEDRKEEE